jgi:hypothetical protein
LFYYEPSDGTEWLTAVAVNSSQLFSRKPWLIILHSAGLLAQPHLRPSRLRSGCGGDGPDEIGKVFTATGIAPESKPDFPFNDQRVHDQPQCKSKISERFYLEEEGCSQDVDSDD